MKEAPLSGVIYAVLVIVWACVLVPMWVRRNDGETEDIVSSPSRILPRRRLPAEQRTALPPADAATPDAPATAPPAARRPLTPAERRQRLFVAVCALAGFPALLFLAGLVPAAVAVLGALPLAAYGALRYVARRPQGRRPAPAAATSAGDRPARATAPTRPDRPARSRPGRGTRATAPPATATRGTAPPTTTTARGPEPVFDREQYEQPQPAPAPTWSPVPVPLPTYLSSRRGPAAPRRRPPAPRPAPVVPAGEASPAPRRAVND